MKNAWLSLSFVLIFSPLLVAGTDLKFDFGSGAVAPGYTQVTSSSVYNPDQGYGFLTSAGVTEADRKTTDPLTGDFCTATGPFIFGVKLPEGNYDVTVHFGDPAEAASTSIKAESRRLLMEETETKSGELKTFSFTVNIRTPVIATGGTVGLKTGEAPGTWDDRLALEFNGKRPCISGLEITDAKNPLTVYLAGDSTVTDQAGEPWCGWGQCLPRFFQPGVAIANHAQSGLTLSSFEQQRRLVKILSTLKPGDYVFIQFGHNDQKDKNPGAGPFTSYKSNLKHYVEAVRAQEGIPVLVTPMERRRWTNDVPEPTLADYAEAVRQVGAEENVPVIDLNAMSLQFYKALGPEGTKQAFVHYPANTYPGQTKPLMDNTHFNSYGGYELARCMVNGIREKVPALATHLREDAGTFDPSKPDAVAAVHIPASSTTPVVKPAGN